MNQKLKENPLYGKVIHWSKLVSLTGSAQIIIQASSLICGIVVIRLLSKSEYALYTIANTMLSTMTILADGGVATGIMSEGAKVWGNKSQLGSVLTTGFQLRKKFSIISYILAAPMLAYLLVKQGASPLMTGIILVCIIPAFIAALSDSLYEVAPKLNQNIKGLQLNGVIVAIARLIISAILLYFSPFAFMAIVAFTIPRIYGNLQLKKLSAIYAIPNEPINPEVKERIIKIVKLSMPGLIYYALSGQLNVWLISIFGHTDSVATIGAIGKLAMVMGVFSAMFSILVVPRFARLEAKRNKLIGNFLRIQVLVLGVCAIALLGVWLFDSQILKVLGSEYGGYETELMLSMTSSCIALLLGSTYTTYSGRGWIMHPSRSILVSILSIITSVSIFNISTLRGVLYMNIYILSVDYVNHMIYCLHKMTKVEK